MEQQHDLMAIGSHCSVGTCQQLDFLPFKCDCCSRTFCLEHRTYVAHACAKAGSKTQAFEVIVCPVCAKGVHLRGEDPNAAFERHTRTDCDPSNYARVHKKPKCPAPGCKEKLTTINTYTCKTCNQRVCLKHRLELDHKCPGKSAHPLVQRQGGAVAAAAAAAAAAGRNLGSRANNLFSSAAAADGMGSSRPATQQQQRAARQAARQQPPDPTNTVHGTATRRRELLGLPAINSSSQGREQCPQCSSRFGTVQELIQHVEAAHSSGNAAVAAAAAGVPSTQQQQSGGEVFACPTCDRRFADAVLLLSHSEQCRSQQQSTCVLC